MKKSVKISIIIAVVMLISGAIMSVCAAISLGTDYFKNKGDNIVYLEEDFSSIEISSNMCDVWVFASDENTRRIEYSLFGDVALSVKVESGVLKISSEGNKKWYDYIGIVWNDYPHISIYLPPEEYESLSVKTSSGDVCVPGKMSFENVNVKTSSGDIEFSGDVKAKLSLETISGDITISNTNLNLSKVSLKTTSGDIEADGMVASSKIEIKSTSGDLEFNSIDAPEIELETTSGDIEGVLLTKKHINAKTTSGDIHVESDDFCEEICNAETTSGDIKIRVD